MSSLYYYHQQRPFSYVHLDETPTTPTTTDMEVDQQRPQEDYESTAAAQGLLQLYQQSASSQDSFIPSVVSSHVQLNPINQQQQEKTLCRLPSLSNLLLPLDHHQVQPPASWNSTSTSASTASVLYSPSSSSTSGGVGADDFCYSSPSSHYHPTKQQQRQQQLIPPLSHSSSYSSLRSVASSHHSKANLLSRAATLASRRRGRPRKSAVVINATTTTTTTEFKIVDMSSTYHNGSSSSSGGINDDKTEASSPAATSSSTTHNKPRWQEAERLELLEAIVKEKNLDDMATIRWDRISLAVGRAKKACKDQWRRELLPNLMRGFYGGSRSNSTSGSSSGSKKKGGSNNNVA